MAIHTFELQTPSLSLESCEKGKCRVFELARQKQSKINRNESSVLVFQICCIKGLTFAFIDRTISFLAITVNPSILLGGGYADLCDITLENFEQLAASIDKALNMLKLKMTCSYLKLHRIDCTTDVEFPYKNGVVDFLKCLQHTEIFGSYKIDRFDKNHDNFEEKNRHSFRMSCKDVSLTVYDKSYQLLEQKLMESEDIPADRLRFEVAIRNPAFQRLFSRYWGYTEYDLNKKIESFSNMSVQLLREFFERTLTSGQYFQLEGALEIINQSGFSVKMKDRMKDFLYEVSRCHRNGISGAMQAFLKQGLTHRQIQNILEHFRILNLNPATICGDSDFDHFPSVAEILNSESVLPASIS